MKTLTSALLFVSLFYSNLLSQSSATIDFTNSSGAPVTNYTSGPIYVELVDYGYTIKNVYNGTDYQYAVALQNDKLPFWIAWRPFYGGNWIKVTYTSRVAPSTAKPKVSKNPYPDLSP